MVGAHARRDGDRRRTQRAGVVPFERPGVGGPILGTLHRTQTKISPTGRTAPVDGRPWHEVTSGTVTGWVHGRYVTESWTPQEVEALWDWETAVDRFATALGGGGELRAAVSWRGFCVVAADGVLHWWKPDRLPDPPTTNQTVCEAAGGTWTAAAATCEGTRSPVW